MNCETSEMTMDRSEMPTMLLSFLRQYEMSFLNASQSKRMWSSETDTVTASRYGFVSAIMERIESRSAVWNPSDACDCSDISIVSSSCHRAYDMGSNEILSGSARTDRFSGTSFSIVSPMSSKYMDGTYFHVWSGSW